MALSKKSLPTPGLDHDSSSSDCPTLEGVPVIDFDYEEFNNKDFMVSFNDFCWELKLSKLMSNKCLAVLKTDRELNKNL